MTEYNISYPALQNVIFPYPLAIVDMDQTIDKTGAISTTYNQNYELQQISVGSWSGACSEILVMWIMRDDDDVLLYDDEDNQIYGDSEIYTTISGLALTYDYEFTAIYTFSVPLAISNSGTIYDLNTRPFTFYEKPDLGSFYTDEDVLVYDDDDTGIYTYTDDPFIFYPRTWYGDLYDDDDIQLYEDDDVALQDSELPMVFHSKRVDFKYIKKRSRIRSGYNYDSDDFTSNMYSNNNSTLMTLDYDETYTASSMVTTYTAVVT